MKQGDMLQMSFTESDFAEETWKAYREAFKELERAKSIMMREALKTPKGEYMQSIGANILGSMSWNQPNATVQFSASGMTVLHKPFLPIVPGNTPNKYLDHSTIKALLHGKLLTDEEKRRLIQEYLPNGVIQETRPADSEESRDSGEIPF